MSTPSTAPSISAHIFVVALDAAAVVVFTFRVKLDGAVVDTEVCHVAQSELVLIRWF